MHKTNVRLYFILLYFEGRYNIPHLGTFVLEWHLKHFWGLNDPTSSSQYTTYNINIRAHIKEEHQLHIKGSKQLCAIQESSNTSTNSLCINFIISHFIGGTSFSKSSLCLKLFTSHKYRRNYLLHIQWASTYILSNQQDISLTRQHQACSLQLSWSQHHTTSMGAISTMRNKVRENSKYNLSMNFHKNMHIQGNHVIIIILISNTKETQHATISLKHIMQLYHKKSFKHALQINSCNTSK